MSDQDSIRLDPLSADYVALAFGIERHLPGYVDAYLGPAPAREAVMAMSLPEPERLVDEARALAARIAGADIPETRVGYLTAQLEAMLTTCRVLAGKVIPYAEEVHRLFNINAERTPEATFDEAIASLDDLLPGTGPLRERMTAWRQGLEISPASARAIIDAVMPELRERTSALVDLPGGESVEVQFVTDKPWRGYNWYLGHARSRVEVNTDLPIHAHTLVDLICHEAYPGHHTEHALKERLYREDGYGEHAIQLINTPECVISEGIATSAAGAIFPGDELPRFEEERIYPMAGIKAGIDLRAVERIARAEAQLQAVRGNAALLLHADGRPEAEVVTYLQRYRLRSEPEARQDLRFLADPLWRAYTFTYHVGRALVGSWLDGAPTPAERAARFRTLLTDQVYPSQITTWIARDGSA